MNKGRKISGGKYHANRKRKLFEKPGQETKTILGITKRKIRRVRGGNAKIKLLASNSANILTEGKVKKAEIKNVLETPQNRFFARQNILFKGAVIETTLGKARITNRPAQEGHINAVLIKE